MLTLPCPVLPCPAKVSLPSGDHPKHNRESIPRYIPCFKYLPQLLACDLQSALALNALLRDVVFSQPTCCVLSYGYVLQATTPRSFPSEAAQAHRWPVWSIRLAQKGAQAAMSTETGFEILSKQGALRARSLRVSGRLSGTLLLHMTRQGRVTNPIHTGTSLYMQVLSVGLHRRVL